jgi:hypothetical protein
MNIERVSIYLRWLIDILFYDKKLQKQRLDICRSCSYYQKSKCKLCGCFMPLKTRIKEISCPINKWKQDSHNWKI